MKYNQATDEHLTRVLRSCYTSEHYDNAKTWIIRLFKSLDLELPENTRLEMYAAHRRVVQSDLDAYH